MLPRESFEEAIAHHRVIIEKTAGPREMQGLALVMGCLNHRSD
jgi:hypothetical protein